jgi:Flp pilus assembly pilin Flp
MLTELKKVAHDQRGASLIEYVLLIGVVALIAVAGFRVFGASVMAKIAQQAASVATINGTAQ